jgi:transketolase
MASDEKCIQDVRALSADIVQKANSGHPGMPLGCAPFAHVLWKDFMKYSPTEPEWFNRDRFVLSNGHGCALLYAMLHLSGYDVSMDDCKAFRQMDSKCPGHPESFVTAGVEVCTGPLGQGISNAVGLAMGEKHLAAVYNKPGHEIIDHTTYVICGDGCLQEGVSCEASSLAGHWGLGKLIVIYDDNHITIDGDTDLSFTEDVCKRYEAYNWHTITIETPGWEDAKGSTNVDPLREAIKAAQAVTDKPTMIKVRTMIGVGAPNAGSHSVHGAPLGKNMEATKVALGKDPASSFDVADDVYAQYDNKEAGAKLVADWNGQMAKYAEAYPAEHAELTRRINGELPALWKEKFPTYEDGTVKATRQYSQDCLKALGSFPEMVGGSADLAPSNLTEPGGGDSGDFQKDTPKGRYVRFGIREHAMAAICNGLAAHGGFLPYCATFFNFMGYALGAARLSALSRFRVLYIMTHDSIGLGEDGPTHQPVEMGISMRAMPNMHTWRPADGRETVASYQSAISNMTTPSTLCFSRQKVPVLVGSSVEGALKGAYTLNTYGGDKPDLVIVSTGTEVHICVEAAEKLAAAGKCVSIVSAPCLEIFDTQDKAYKFEVFPAGIPVMAVEAWATHGWEKYSHTQVAMRGYGASGPLKAVYEKFGFTGDILAAESQKVIDFYKVRKVCVCVMFPFLLS